MNDTAVLSLIVITGSKHRKKAGARKDSQVQAGRTKCEG